MGMLGLEPRCTLADVYGEDVVYLARPDPRATGWIPGRPWDHDVATGFTLPHAGPLTLLCWSQCLHPSIQRLYADLGLDWPARVVAYDDEAGYAARLDAFSAAGRTIVPGFFHDPEHLPAKRWWVPPPLVSRLNNKRALAEFVSPEHVLPRQVVARRDLPTAGREALPCAVKVVTDLGSGGGVDVRICHTAEDLASAGEAFRKVEEVVVEAWVPDVRIHCAQFAAHADGRLTALGASEQICGPDGRPRGNWVEADARFETDLQRVAHPIVDAARAKGYVGLAGFDLARTPEGRIFVLDLNFRLNASTGGLLFADALLERWDRPTTFLGGFGFEGGCEDLVGRVRDMAAARRFLPLALAWDAGSSTGRTIGLVCGADRDDVKGVLPTLRKAFGANG